MTLDEELEREFEDRLRESSTLAFRVAYGVLRHRQDAEDVAQEAFAKAYRQLQPAPRSRPVPGLAGPDDVAAGHRSLARGAAPDRSGAGGRGDDGGPTTEQDVALSRERADQLWRAIDALPEKLRIVDRAVGASKGTTCGRSRTLLDLPKAP